MSRGRWGALALGAASGALASCALVAACGAFDDDSSTAAADAGVDASEIDATSDRAAPGDDGGDAGADGSFPTIACGGRRCKAKTAACCLYFDKGAVDTAQSECVGAVTECPSKLNDGGQAETVVKIGCDDPGDCEIGQVCCHYSASACTSETLRSGVCVAPDNCRACGLDGGVGYTACDPAVSGQCGDGGRTCTRRIAVGPYDYCSP